MTKRTPESEPPTKALAKLGEGQAWRGDEHELRLAAAREAGLETEELNEVELDLFTEGFKAGMVLDDPDDRAIVLRGRTVLRENQMGKALRPTFKFLGVPNDQVALRIFDGEFELRVSQNVAEAAKPALDSARLVLKLWIGLGLVGMLAWYWFSLAWLAALLWGGALVGGGYVLRQGAVSGRALLGARLTVALAMLAQQEKLILPPSRQRPAEAP
ncbi:hypothetical protein ENSA5_41230 [Enhygromyxa salina]|uniref:Uncharacterized protein n=1 Tax=Enhygromyxa salina TaxID=215803 RepID=A0A2S9XMR8_9BACT|nr:hypothetical protein [Enhygromyxa salina]PRP94168.1 hypothetical protein ENSA5_41230 [Enhygromyxa salina]